MLNTLLALRFNPLLVGLGLLLVGVVVGYGSRGDQEEEFAAAVRVGLVQPEFKIPPEVQLLADLEYARPKGQPLLLDLYRPEEVTSPLPVILWIHGGGWRSGSKDEPAAVELVSKGYAVASIDYRLSDVAIFPAQIEDCQAAVRWLRSHAREYNLNPDRIGAWGESSGAHLAALLGAMSHGVSETDGVSADVQAVVDIEGPIDFLTLDEQALDEAAIRHSDPWSPESLLVGGPIHERPDLVALANPLTHLQTGRRPPPFLVIHGRDDRVVPMQQSDQLVQALRRSRGSVQYLRVRNRYHGDALTPELLEVVTDFFDRRLKQVSRSRPSAPSFRKRARG